MVRRLLYLNGIAILGVVLNHVSGWGFIAMFWWTDRYLPVTVPNFDQMGSLNYYILRLFEQFANLAIPAFLFVSGFFVAVATGRNQKTIAWKVVFKRIINLIIPYLIWSMVYLVLEFLQGSEYTVGSVLWILLTGKATDAFYFVPVLVQLYLLSPLLVLAAKARWAWLLLATALLQIFVLLLHYVKVVGLEVPALEPFMFLTQTWLFPGLAFWFVFGIVMGFHGGVMRAFIARLKWVWLSILLILFPLGILEWEFLLRASGEIWIGPNLTLLDCFFSAAFLLTFIAFDQVTLPWTRQIGNLGTRSYGIFLVHNLALIYASKVIYHVLPGLLGYPLVYIALLIFLGLAVPLGLMWIVERSPAKKFYGYLFG